MASARITETTEGRIILRRLTPTVQGKSICLEIHRTGDVKGVRFLLMSAEEFERLRQDVNDFSGIANPVARENEMLRGLLANVMDDVRVGDGNLSGVTAELAKTINASLKER